MSDRLLTKWCVLAIGITFHLVFLMSIFDIYFVSPLVHGMRHFPSNGGQVGKENVPPPAKRLFLVVGDGLRADKCFEKVHHPTLETDMYLAPYIRSKAAHDGTFGISHTRMPTESRPGHVALIAGFYEDVSAVTKGWQENPVNFDSVFNQSVHTWSFGSPDILPMFGKGADPGKVDMVMYGHSSEDFTRSSIDLDAFVFDHMEDLFAQAETNKTLYDELNREGVVFFLHLLGIDTAGHSYRPYSAEYYDNIRYIDRKIEQLEKDVNKFYKDDDRTAWVFTADHGMSDFGSHGDGHPNNTRTPLVAWGAGVHEPVKGLDGHDKETELWDLPVQRHDVNQADIASLMAYLVDIPYPANSVGELPLSYLDADPSEKARALVANAYSISEQYLVKENQVKNTQFRFKPFPPFAQDTLATRKQAIEALLQEGQYKQATIDADELMGLSLKGLRYLQTYNWLLLRTLVTFGFIGWIAYAFTSFLHLFVVRTSKARPENATMLEKGTAVVVFAVLSTLLHQQDPPLNYYLYAFFPVFFWYLVFTNRFTVVDGLKLLFEGEDLKTQSLLSKVVIIFFGLCVIEAMVYGYFHREIYSLLLVLLCMPWPWVSNWRLAVKNFRYSLLWSVSCLTLSIFTVQPVIKVENLDMIVGSGLMMFVLSFGYTVYLSRVLRLRGITMVTCGVQLGLILLAVIVTRSAVVSLQARKGLPIGTQLVGWMTLFFSLGAPFMHSLTPVTDFRFKYLSMFMVFCPTMIILTISYEGYFYVAFALLLFSWFEMESRFRTQARPLLLVDFRLALMFFFFTHIAFFGTGNIASISSFSLDSVYRLVPVFNPFAWSALLIFKLLIPFVLLSLALGIVNITMLLPSYAIFSMVLSISDILSLNFFYLVVDEGSWLDIGTGISHFCICSMLCIFIIFLEYLSSILVSSQQQGVSIPARQASLQAGKSAAAKKT